MLMAKSAEKGEDHLFLRLLPTLDIDGLHMRRLWLKLLHTCRWEDPDDLAIKAHKFIESNWAAAYQLFARPKAWTKPT